MPEPAVPQGTLLAFDFGRRRIGIAVGQTTTFTATALTTVRCTETPDWRHIKKLIDDWRPAALVVGLPLASDGSETDMSAAARRFGAELAERFGLPIIHADERLTSRQANTEFAAQRAAGQARRRDASRLDAMAAKILLENWLQSLAARERREPGGR